MCVNSVLGDPLHTRGDQKVLQFSMLYKRHRQNNYTVFQCNLPLYQYTSDVCQKVPQFQQNRIPGAFWTGVRKHGTHLARTSLKPKYSCKIFKTSVAISRTLRRRSPNTRFSTARQQSSLVASTGRPARVSSSSDVRPRLNSATHLVTVE